ncbi:phosphohistidine phosphatase [Sphingobacterium sp. SGG-5]|uniref:SixA phosphatase family protein n=1 Tax=Sphingobacterium sp. SGG-5 TaxID=2710881 RepID=UPI0013E9E056|nr:histidine phosphatase family protein [Sphingobacterium sp. SGG-5]NGM63268.1 phosphohistidine phosphatase [Sphingobacterium sp. SGG-5]
MKTKNLYLIRHAKAEEHSFAKRDYDRNLVEKGKERAVRIATELKTKSILTPNTLVISSPANRALQTATLFCELLRYPVAQIHQEQSIYEAHFLDILAIINKVPDTVDTVILFGHNPGLSDLTNYICGTYANLNTSSVVIISLPHNFNFSDLSEGTATLKEILS